MYVNIYKIMDKLYEYYDNIARNTDDSFFRFLLDKINWDQRMLAIKGPRGSGKTTLMIQYIKYRLKKPREQVLYVTADHYWFYNHNLVETADQFYKYGGRYLFIDEVHKYPNWSRELKNIYDGYPDLRVVFSSSSALHIYRGEADLSRRVITYDLPGLSFREFLGLREGVYFPRLEWCDLVDNSYDFIAEVIQKLRPLPAFREYLRYGYLPVITENKPEDIPLRLAQVINAVLESDLAVIENYSRAATFKIKKLLGVLAEVVPFKPNISALARKLEVNRDAVYDWFSHLENARLLNLLTAEGKGVSVLQKPDKVYFENTNLAYALRDSPDKGSLRETFLLGQLINAGHTVKLPEKGDFLTGDTYIEVGGKNKTTRQVREEGNYLIAADDIEMGYGKKVPLWLFGFLY